MALTDALRENWSRRINAEMRASTLLDSPTFINRDYEPDSMDSNKVRMVTFNNVDAETYDPAGSSDVTIKDISDRKVELPLDQFPVVPWKVEGMHELQINTNVRNGTIRNAGLELARVRDKFIAKKMATGIAPGIDAMTVDPSSLSTNANVFGVGSTDKGLKVNVTAGQTAIKKAITDMAIRMDELGVPEEGRFLLVPPGFRNFIKDQFNLDTERHETRIARGWMTSLYGFEVYKTHYLHQTIQTGTPALTRGESHWAVAGHPSAFTFADQAMVGFDAHPMEKRPKAIRIFATAQYGAAYKNQYAIDATGVTTGQPGNCLMQLDTKATS